MWQLIGGIYLGWGIGANDSANVFGTAVSTRVIKWSTAVIIISIAAILGSYLQGGPTVKFVKTKLGEIKDLQQGFIASFSAALTVMILTILAIPTSTSQATAGAIIGMTLAFGGSPNWAGLVKAFICWVFTPIGAAFFSIILFYIFQKFINRIKNIVIINRIVLIGTLISGAVAAYSLGANNCGNATGFFYHPEDKSVLLNNLNILALIGGISIALGALTYSKKVMLTVGEGITQLDPMSSLITVFSQGITVWIFAIVGVPVSTSQAVVGAVMGIGFVKGMKSVNFKKLFQILLGWFSTPLSSAIVAFIISKIFS